jgi:hypothetical protein
LSFLLGPDQQEIKNDEHQDDRDKSAKSRSTFSAATTHCVCDIDQNITSLC